MFRSKSEKLAAERDFAKPTSDFHRFAKKNAGGRYKALTPEERFQAMMKAPQAFKPKPVQPPLKPKGT